MAKKLKILDASKEFNYIHFEGSTDSIEALFKLVTQSRYIQVSTKKPTQINIVCMDNEMYEALLILFNDEKVVV